MYIHIHFLLGALQEANPYAEQDRYGSIPRVSLSAPKAYSAFKTATQQQQQKTTARSQGQLRKGSRGKGGQTEARAGTQGSQLWAEYKQAVRERNVHSWQGLHSSYFALYREKNPKQITVLSKIKM